MGSELQIPSLGGEESSLNQEGEWGYGGVPIVSAAGPLLARHLLFPKVTVSASIHLSFSSFAKGKGSPKVAN